MNVHAFLMQTTILYYVDGLHRYYVVTRQSTGVL